MKNINKVERKPGESEQACVARGIPILIREGMSPEQAQAVAHSMCRTKKSAHLNGPCPPGKVRRNGVCVNKAEALKIDEEEKSKSDTLKKGFWDGLPL